MKIMRYIGASIEEAESKAKEALGSEVVILNTRKKRRDGFWGRFRRSIYETIAAVEEEKPAPHSEPKYPQAPTQSRPKESMPKVDIKGHLKEMQYRAYQKREDGLLSEEHATTKAMPDVGYGSITEYYYENLLNNGVEIKIAKQLIHMAKDKIEGEYGGNYKMFPQQLRRSIESYLGKIEPIKITKSQNIIFFIGPTGVGKTTTLAKIAAQYAMANKEKVAVITADTYRIAAVEQLRVYSEILDIPLQTIYDAREIVNVLESYGDKELILVDTAGRSHNNQSKIDELSDMIQSLQHKEVYLVLSATTDFGVLKNIIKKYNFIEDYKIIFTKMDEVEKYGIILNTRFFTNKALSYLTTGQSVPEDIQVINVSEISKQLIGER